MFTTTITELFKYGFMQKAFIAGVAVAICCSLLGTFLVLRRMSLIGDGIAHLAFGGIALGMLFNIQPLFMALGVAVLGSLWVQRVVEKVKLYGDSAIAVIISLGMATGIVIIGAVKGFTVNLFSYLFGNILSLSVMDVVLSIVTLILVAAFVFIFYKQLVFISFNEELSIVNGVNARLVTTVLSILTAFTIIITIRAVGILLVSALLVIPALIALQTASSFKRTLFIAVASAVAAVLIGTVIAFIVDIPVGGTIVLLLVAEFAAILLWSSAKGRFRKYINTKRGLCQ